MACSGEMYCGVPTTMPVRVATGPGSPSEALLDLGDAEVEDLGRLRRSGPGEQDVVGLDVAVDDAELVGGGQRGGDLARDAPAQRRSGERALDGGRTSRRFCPPRTP